MTSCIAHSPPPTDPDPSGQDPSAPKPAPLKPPDWLQILGFIAVAVTFGPSGLACWVILTSIARWGPRLSRHPHETKPPRR